MTTWIITRLDPPPEQIMFIGEDRARGIRWCGLKYYGRNRRHLTKGPWRIQTLEKWMEEWGLKSKQVERG